ncbi:MAG: hypothetical protein KGD68_01985 [Candidatus Lokiarchaeota archaeon]|nr:hypothetical protein [Candidatus Lokiarchaeota archaeon]
MKIDHTHKRISRTDGIINMESPVCVVAGKIEDRFTLVSISNNCKVILGMNSRG